MPAEPIKYRPNTLVEKIAKMRSFFLETLPGDEIKVLGEIIETRKTSKFTELTLLDPTDGASSFSARLPPDLPDPAEDYVVGVTGRLDINCDGLSMEVFLQGTRFDLSTAPCRNRNERMKCLDDLKAEIEHLKVRALRMPLRRIGLVTGDNTRAEHDVRWRLNRSKCSIGVKLFPVHLRDAASIAEGIGQAASDPEVDAIVVARGGGASYDLHHFNRPEVLRAIAEAVRQKFVLTAIGHAKDRTLADELASHSEPVPTTAASYLINQVFKHEETARGAGRLPSPPRTQPAQPGLVYRAKRWFRRWLRRATIFAAGALAGSLLTPLYLTHVGDKQPSRSQQITGPGDDHASSKRRIEAEDRAERTDEMVAPAGQQRADERARSKRRER